MAKARVTPKRPPPKAPPLHKIALTWTNGTRTERISGPQLARLLDVSERRLYSESGPTMRERWTDPDGMAMELEQLSHVVALAALALPSDMDPNHQVIRALLFVHEALEQLGHRVSGLAVRPEQIRLSMGKAGRR